MIESIRALLDSLAVSFDLPILDWIAANLWCPILDTVMPIITMFGDDGIFWIACAVLLGILAYMMRNSDKKLKAEYAVSGK